MYVENCEYLMNVSCLKQMQNEIGSSRLCELAYTHLRRHHSWKQNTNSRILKLNWKSKKVCKIIKPVASLDELVVVNYNAGWYNAFIAHVEGRGVMILTNKRQIRDN